MNINIQPLNFSDADMLDKIFHWRNEVKARGNFINNNAITPEIFIKIIKKYKESPISPYIIHYENKAVGYIYFTYDENLKLFIGINIDEKYRGLKISKIALESILNIIKCSYSSTVIYAKIKKHNIASTKLFSAYFNLLKNENDNDDEYVNYFFSTVSYVLCSVNSYYTNTLFSTLCSKYINIIWKLITDNNTFKDEILAISPVKCFFFHWPYIVPKKIYDQIECINFHTGNLPYGRGGSPLQNQISENILTSYVNALKITNDGIDSGPSYNKEQISLQGNIFDIFNVLSNVVYNLIIDIIENKLEPLIIYNFTDIPIYNRLKNNHLLTENKNIEEIYNQIRMRDYKYYEKTYIDYNEYRLTFSRASFDGERILCDAEIVLKR